VLVLTRDSAIEQLHWVTVAPLTRTIRGLDSEVVLEPDADRLDDRCAVTLDNIATVEQMLLVERLTRLSADRMNEVWEALHFALEMPF
jgi:mRNA interferase MazF